MFYDTVSIPGTANWAFRSVYNAPLMTLLLHGGLGAKMGWPSLEEKKKDRIWICCVHRPRIGIPGSHDSSQKLWYNIITALETLISLSLHHSTFNGYSFP